MKNKSSFYIKLAIVVFLIFGFRFIPPFGPLTPNGMHVLGIFFGVVIGWSALDIFIPSILALLSMSFVEGFTLASITASGFGSSVFWMIVFMMLFVAVFEKAKGTEFIATWFITRKIAQGKPVVFTFMFLFGTFMVGMLNPIASCILFYSVLYKICGQLGYQPHDNYPTYMLFGVTFASMFGSISHSLFGTPLVLSSAFMAASGIQLNLLDFVKVGWPFSVFLLLVYSFCMKSVFRCDMKALKELDVDAVVDKNALTVTTRLKVMALMIVLLIAGIAGGVLLPAQWAFTQVLAKLGLQGLSMLLLAVLAVWNVEDEPMFQLEKFTSSLPWGVLFISATIMPLSSMLTMQGTGINEFIGSLVGGFLSGLPSSIFVAVVLLVGVILTNIGNNASMCILLMPVILNVCGTNGINPAPLYMCMIFAVHLAMLTPGACPYAALVWGNKEWIAAKDVYRCVPIIIVVFYILIVTVGYAWAQIML